MTKIGHIISIFITAVAFQPALAFAQAYPSKPLHMIVGTQAGGAVDTLARGSATYLSPALGQPVVVENRPGASNMIANRYVANSKPDGYTLLMLGNSLAVTEAASIANGEDNSFDTLKELTIVSTVVTNPYGLAVRANLPVKNVNEFIALARTKPGLITYGSTGVGKVDHLAMEMLQQQTGVKLLHVPFKGTSDAINEILGGRLDAMFISAGQLVPYVQSGDVRVVAMMSSKRSSLFPDVPTIADAVPLKGFAVDVWAATGVAAATPAPIVERLNSEYKKMLSDPAFVSKYLTPQGFEPFYMTPAEAAATYRAELEKFTKLIKDLGLKIAN